MRTYTITRKCGHTTRTSNKAKALRKPCLDCTLDAMKAAAHVVQPTPTTSAERWQAAARTTPPTDRH